MKKRPLLSHGMQAFLWQNETFIIDSRRVLFWERTKTLICSDLHLGKTGHFRKEGIAVPQAVYRQDLNRLFDAIQFYKPHRVLMVGDLFHSNANKEWDWFARWRLDFPGIEFLLVIGNHDRVPTLFAQKMALQVEPWWMIDDFLFLHNPDETLPANINPKAIISGHIHPAIIVAANVRQKIRLPCFFFSEKQCLLPAFSLFTGCFILKPKKADVVFALAGNEIIAFSRQ